MMRQTILLMGLFVCTFFSVNAQISTDEEPVSFREGKIPSRFSVSQDIRTMPALDMNRIEQEDAKDEANGLPPRFGYPHEVSLNLENSGRWQELSNGDRLWQLTIRCPQALSINLLYDKFWLPEGGKFFVYTTDRKHSIGAFTSINNKGGRDNVQGFATGLLYGDEVTLEYYQPKQVAEQAIISIAYVVQGYRYIELPGDVATRDFGGSQNCHVNINCPEGRNWQREKNAVAMILVNGIRYCTGSLINTTANDNRPLLLTADHCLGIKYDAINNPILNHWSFWWHYEAPGCDKISKDLTMLMTSGATVLANDAESDFALLELREDPRDKTGVIPYYLGWDRSGNPGTGGVGIHHPSGDLKKISTYTITPTSTDYCGSSTNSSSSHWRVLWSATATNHGVTERGSSGSPLLNNNHQIIGQLHGGYSNCSTYVYNNKKYGPNEPDWYGKFSTSWNGYNVSDFRRRLKDWLDPISKNPQTWNGMGIMKNSSPSLFGPTVICNQEMYTMLNLPSGASVLWSTSNNNLQLVYGQGTRNAVFSKRNKGQSTIRAQVTINGRTINSDKIDIWVGEPDIWGIDGYESLPAPGAEFYKAQVQGHTSCIWECNDKTYCEITPFKSSAVFDFKRAGIYIISATGVNDCGHSKTVSYTVKVDNRRTFSLFPNPATDVVTLRLTEASGGIQSPQGQGSLTTKGVTSTYEIQLWNGLTMLKSFKTNQLTFQIPIAGLPAGLYFVRVIKDEQTYTEKLIKN